MKLLLTSVFGPYGVDDAYGRKENIMELFHNQVTREQGVFSLRINHQSAGLHLIAENIRIPTMVLDFPSKKRFRDEVKKGYDYIGISFIVPNFVKAREMARMIRKLSPRTRIRCWSGSAARQRSISSRLKTTRPLMAPPLTPMPCPKTLFSAVA